MSEQVSSLIKIENSAELKVEEWRRTKSDTTGLKQELLTLISDKTFHSAKLMRLYAEVLLRNHEFKESYAAFETYVSLQDLALLKKKSGARSAPDPFESGTLNIFTLVLSTLEHQGQQALPRVLKLGEQLAKLAETHASLSDSNTISTAVASLFARIAVAKILAAEDNQSYNQCVDEARTWFGKLGEYDTVDANTCYAQGLFLALTQPPQTAFDVVKLALKKQINHSRAVLLLVQLLSAEQQLDAALEVANAYLARKPEARSIVDRTALVRLKKSQIALLEVLKGSETALNELGEFIAFITELYAAAGSDLDGGAAAATAMHAPNGNGAANGHSNGGSTHDEHHPRAAHRIFSFRRRHTNESITPARSHDSGAANGNGNGVANGTTNGHSAQEARALAFSWFWIAQQYIKVGLENEARQAIEEGRSSLSSDDLVGTACIQATIGQIEQKSNPERALKHYLLALETDPLHISAAVGATLVLDNDKTKSLGDNELVLTLMGSLSSISSRNPGRFIPEVWYARGMLYERLEIENEARDMYWTAIQLEQRQGVTGYVVTSQEPL